MMAQNRDANFLSVDFVDDVVREASQIEAAPNTID
jgi:hypothetical protein